jgi:hypothetical protein
MGCSGSTAMEDRHGPMSPKRGFASSRQFLIFRYFGQLVDKTDVGLRELDSYTPMWSILQYLCGLQPDAEMPLLAEFVERAGMVETRRAIAGFANVLNILVHDAAEKAAKFVLAFEAEETWNGKNRNKLLMLVADTMEQTWALVAERCGVSSEWASVVVVAQVLRAMQQLHKMKESERAGNFELFHIPSWNRVIRLMLRGVWKGDEVLGQAPDLFAYHAIRAFLASASFSAPYANSRDATETDSEQKQNKTLSLMKPEWFLPLDGYTKAAIAHTMFVRNNKTDERSTVLKAKLSRERTFLDLMDFIVSEEKLVWKGGGEPVPTFSPVFVDRFGNKEAGEGHGPRKEMFMLLSGQISTKWSEERKGVGAVVAKRGKRELRLEDDYNSFKKQGVKPGHKIVLYLDESTSSTPHQVVVASSPDAVKDDVLQLTSILPYHIRTGVEFGVCAPSLPLLEYHQANESYWPNVKLEYEEEYEQAYRMLGWLMAAAILNRSVFSVRLDRLLFRQLIASRSVSNTSKETGDFAHVAAERWDGEFTPIALDFQEFDRVLYDHVVKATEVPDAEFRELLVSDSRGEDTTRAAYVQWRIEQVLVGQVSWQIDALRAGFRAGLGSANVDIMKGMHVRSGELLEMVCGPVRGDEDFDLSHYYRICLDSCAQEQKELLDIVWDVINSWEVPKKRLFLKFFSGLERLPAPGSEDLVVEMPFDGYSMPEHRRMVHMLPQAHTCSNTLEIPSYLDSLQELARADPDSEYYGLEEKDLLGPLRAIVEQKFTMAIESQSGYGLDEREQSISINPSQRRNSKMNRQASSGRLTTHESTTQSTAEVSSNISSRRSSDSSNSSSSESSDDDTKFTPKHKSTKAAFQVYTPHAKASGGNDPLGISMDLESDFDLSMSMASPMKATKNTKKTNLFKTPVQEAVFFSPTDDHDDSDSADTPQPKQAQGGSLFYSPVPVAAASSSQKQKQTQKQKPKKLSLVEQDELLDLEDMLAGIDI